MNNSKGLPSAIGRGPVGSFDVLQEFEPEFRDVSLLIEPFRSLQTDRSILSYEAHFFVPFAVGNADFRCLLSAPKFTTPSGFA
jgi:hypothetical protein